MRYCIVIISFLIMYSCNENYVIKDHILNGNIDYHKRNFENAITDYKKALFLDGLDTISNHNIGNGFYRIKEFEEAINYYKTVDSLGFYLKTKSEAKHNEGNAYIKSQKFEEALEAYKEALRNNPNDLETQYNLNVALEKIKQKEEKEKRQKEKEKQQKKQQQNQQKQNQQKQNQQQEKDKQSSENQKEQKQQKNQSQNKKEEEKEKNSKSKPQSDQKKKEEQSKDQTPSQPQNSTQKQERGEKTDLSISKEQVEAILRALENEEKAIQRKILDKERKKQNSTKKMDKDW